MRLRRGERHDDQPGKLGRHDAEPRCERSIAAQLRHEQRAETDAHRLVEGEREPMQSDRTECKQRQEPVSVHDRGGLQGARPNGRDLTTSRARSESVSRT